MLTTKEAARYLGLAGPYLRLLIAQGRGPTTAARGPGHERTAPRYFEREELDRWQANRTRIVRAPSAAT